MPSDVNSPDGSSPEDQRNVSDSQPDEVKHLDGKLQDLAEKPAVQSIVDRLMNPDAGDDTSDDLDNHEEDEEANEAEADDKAEVEKTEDADGTDKADASTDEAPDDATKPKADETATTDAPEGDAADTTADAKKVDEEAGDPDDQEMRGYSRDANKRIRQLVQARKTVEAKLAEKDAEIEQLREKASYRDTLEETLKTHQVDSKTWDEWADLGLLMQRDPRKAAVILGTMAKSLGFRDPDGAIDKLDDDLAKMVADQEMTKEAAEKMQRHRLKLNPVILPTGDPAPTQRQAPVNPQQNQPRSLPRLTRDDTEVGKRAIAAVDAEFRKKYPDQWGKLAPEVQVEMAKYKGTPPHLWGQIARDCAEKVVAKRMAKAPTTTRRPDPTLRSQPGSSRSTPRNESGAAKSKNELADRIVAGTSGKGSIRR